VVVEAGAWVSGDRAAEQAALLFDALAAHAAADAVGAAAELLQRTVAYVKEREQFGRPVGRFQALKHHCSTMALDVDASQSVVRGAANALDDADRAARARAVSVAASRR